MAAYTTIDNPGEYFNTKLYTGTGSSHAITGVGFAPNWVWIKKRSASGAHGLLDTVRGVHESLASNSNGGTNDDSNSLTAFGSDGFTVGSSGAFNGGSATFASWNWKETATAGFDIVTYSGSAASSKTISHSLSAVPKMIIVKCRSADENWAVYHHTLGNTHALFLNTTGAKSDTPVFADTTPTSSVFSVSADDRTGADGKTYVAYVFADVKGYSKFGSYTGNGNANGTFIYTGFKPAFVIRKKSSGAESWQMHDNKRDTFNVVYHRLLAEDNGSEYTSSSNQLDFLSNGFKMRATNDGGNASGGTYIYMAFAENPFVTSGGVPATAR